MTSIVDAKKTSDGSLPAALPPDEARRVEELRAYGVLDTLPEAVYDDLVFLVSYVCQTPIALISFIDSDRQWFKAKVGIDLSETSRDMAFCAHAILEKDKILEVEDTLQDPRFDTNPFVRADPSIRFYAGVPLVSAAGFALGTVCAIDRRPRSLSEDQRRALTALSRAVMTQLELRRGVLALEQEVVALRDARLTQAQVASTPMEDRVRALLLRMQDLNRPAEPDGDAAAPSYR